MSVDNTAWDVLRAIPPCVVTGEAAGTAAALAALHTHGDVHALRYEALRDQLLGQGVLMDPDLVGKSAPARRSSGLLGNTRERGCGEGSAKTPTTLRRG